MTAQNFEKRPPVIVVLGHVDHGKTTLLSKIRESAMPKEPGKITQYTAAYEVEHHGKKLTFIDTPGHEAFSKMRSRGAKVADLAILVVAVDDGVQPQTKEAIKVLKETETPFVVALNKVDKEGIDINKVKSELTAEGVLLEGYGGNVSVQPISGKTGQGVPELLDLLLLAADLEDLTYNPQNPARGVILEVKLESRRGIVATGILKDGMLRVGDPIISGSASGKVKSLEDFLGKKIKEAIPSMPVLILGFESLPQVGAEFLAGTAASRIDTNIPRTTRIKDISEIRAPISDDSRVLNLILKADVTGSLEALVTVLENLPKPEKTVMKIIDQSVGEITDGDVQLAISAKAKIIGFKTSPSRAAANLAQIHKVRIITSEVVYELVKALEEEFKSLAKEVIRGDLEVLALFGKKGAKQQIVGGKVISGAIENNSILEIERGEKVLGQGKVLNLQQEKKDTAKVGAGNEGGLLVESEVGIKIGDHLIMR